MKLSSNILNKFTFTWFIENAKHELLIYCSIWMIKEQKEKKKNHLSGRRELTYLKHCCNNCRSQLLITITWKSILHTAQDNRQRWCIKCTKNKKQTREMVWRKCVSICAMTSSNFRGNCTMHINYGLRCVDEKTQW